MGGGEDRIGDTHQDNSTYPAHNLWSPHQQHMAPVSPFGLAGWYYKKNAYT